MIKNKGSVLLGALIAGLVSSVGVGCSDRQAVANGEVIQDRRALTELGRLHLALETGSDQRFRLVNASFEVRDANGVETLTLSSDNDAGASLEAQLPQGDYVIELLPGWALEGSGGTSVVQSALVTRNPTVFEIQHGQVTDLAFVFATSSGQVTLGEGDVELGIDVVNGKTLEACDLLDKSACPEGQTCLLALDNRRTFCATPGALEVGAECDSDQCVAGAQCLATSGDDGAKRTCMHFCDPDTEFPLCDCRGLSDDDTVGVCVGPATCEPNCLLPSTFTYLDETIPTTSTPRRSRPSLQV